MTSIHKVRLTATRPFVHLCVCLRFAYHVKASLLFNTSAWAMSEALISVDNSMKRVNKKETSLSQACYGLKRVDSGTRVL